MCWILPRMRTVPTTVAVEPVLTALSLAGLTAGEGALSFCGRLLIPRICIASIEKRAEDFRPVHQSSPAIRQNACQNKALSRFSRLASFARGLVQSLQRRLQNSRSVETAMTLGFFASGRDARAAAMHRGRRWVTHEYSEPAALRLCSEEH
jgi:hypothetical protein